MQIALLPVAPILLLPFIILFFLLVFPLWLVSVAVLGIVLGVTRGFETIVRLAQPTLGRPVSGPVGNAFHWTLSWGGLAERRDKPPPE